MPEAPFGQAEPVPWCDVVIPDAHFPGRFERAFGLLVGMLVKLVAEGNSAHSEAKFRLEYLLRTVWHGFDRFRFNNCECRTKGRVEAVSLGWLVAA